MFLAFVVNAGIYRKVRGATVWTPIVTTPAVTGADKDLVDFIWPIDKLSTFMSEKPVCGDRSMLVNLSRGFGRSIAMEGARVDSHT